MFRKIKCLVVLVWALILPLQAIPNFSNQNDLAVLEVFFRTLMQETEMGYVMEGVKPVSWIACYTPTTCWDPESDSCKGDWAIVEGASLWKKYAPKSSKLMIYVSPEHNNHKEILVINVPYFLKVCRDHLPLFQYVLGPHVTPESLLSQITSSDKPFLECMKKDNVLIGLLLGFKLNSSLIAGRIDNLTENNSRRDFPPFSPVAHADLEDDSDPLAFRQFLEASFADYDYVSDSKTPQHSIKPGLGFSSAKQELKYWKTKEVALPPSLYNEKPNFIFGPYQGKETETFLDQLLLAQKRIQTVLQKEFILPGVLKAVYEGEIIVVSDQPSKIPKIKADYGSKDLDLLMARNAWECCLEVEEEIRPVCIKAFTDPSQPSLENPGWRPYGASVAGAKAIKKNLTEADAYFNYLTDKNDLQWIVPKNLCYRVKNVGNGESISNKQQLLLSYRFWDNEGNWLAAEHKVWVDLEETLPSFSHAVQGMGVGEKRYICIHPSLGYGIATGLKSGSVLHAEVILHEAKEDSSSSPPQLVKQDFSFLNDDRYLSELKSDLEGIFFNLAKKLALYVQKRPEFDFKKVGDYFLALSKGTMAYEPLSDEEYKILATIAWNQNFAEKSLLESGLRIPKMTKP